jgi:hypothetical protein
MGNDKLFDSRASIWASQVELRSRLPERMTKDAAMELAMTAFAAGFERGHFGYLETSIDHSRYRIRLGEATRQINAYVFDPPHKLIELHAEQGSGALTPDEARSLGQWLLQRADGIEPSKQKTWFRRLLGSR